MTKINIEGFVRDGKYVVRLSNDEGREDEELFDTEEEARACIDRMMGTARESGKLEVANYWSAAAHGVGEA